MVRRAYFPEADLMFGHDGRDTNPVFGLYKYGPYGNREGNFVKIGIIGSADSIEATRRFLSRIQDPIACQDDYSVPFPGISNDRSQFRYGFQYQEDWIRPFSTRSLHILSELDSRIERIYYALGLIREELQALKEIDPRPQVVIIAIPKEMVRLCQKPRLKTTRIKITNRNFRRDQVPENRDFDFHNIIKCYGLAPPAIPTQLIFPEALKENPLGTQQLSTIAWNFSVAMLYKSTAQPWKFWQFPDDTVFIGISFYRDFARTLGGSSVNVLRSSVSHVFLSNGGNYIVKGQPFVWDQPRREPHLTGEYAESLMLDILTKCRRIWGNPPRRVVIHKSSYFEEEESSGFHSAFDHFNVDRWDFVSIKPADLRVYRTNGQYPVLRGTYFRMGEEDHYLTTTGYIPSLSTYPGPRVPRPLHIKLNQSNSSVEPSQIFKEILALTKLDWNDTKFSVHMPITIRLSRKVSNIFVESAMDSIHHPETEYRYFM